VSYTGARPVLVDSERRTWNMDIGQVEAKVTPGQRRSASSTPTATRWTLDAVWEIARQHDLYVVEMPPRPTVRSTREAVRQPGRRRSL